MEPQIGQMMGDLEQRCLDSMSVDALQVALAAAKCCSTDTCGVNGAHGNCNDNRHCECRDGYFGEQCDGDPCEGIDCGTHGACDTGVCVCTDRGYSGSACEVFDPCVSVDCGAHGTCCGGT